jgi:hypothetical protein
MIDLELLTAGLTFNILRREDEIVLQFPDNNMLIKFFNLMKPYHVFIINLMWKPFIFTRMLNLVNLIVTKEHFIINVILNK